MAPGLRQLWKLDPVRDLVMWEYMGGDKTGGICVYLKGVQRGGRFGERSGRAEADGGQHGGDGCRTKI